jgi:trimethylamine:corrinoid methyltransferase-like protein
MKGFKRRFEAHKMLSEQQIYQIQQATLRILRETGILVTNEKAQEIYSSNGARVDKKSNRVRIPDHMVVDMFTKSPSDFRIRARNPDNDVVLQGAGDTTYFCAGLGNQMLDIDTWELRDPSRKEFYDHIRVLDSLPNVHILPPFPFYGFAKVPQIMRLIESQACKVRTSTKANIEGGVRNNDRWTIELAKATNQDVSLLCNPTPPLSIIEDSVDDILRATEKGMPFWFSTGPVAGATSPTTIAGMLACCNAENIAGMVLAQLHRPGSRIWMGSFMFVQDMATGGPKFGAVENMLAETLFHQVWRDYQIPAYACASCWSASKTVDYQAGYEHGMAALNAAQAGANVVLLQGGFTAELAASPVKAIIDDEIAGMIGRYLQGVEISDETLCVELVNDVGPFPGEFLSTKHTRQSWKKEQYMRKVADTLPYEQWCKAGKKTVIEHARDKLEELVSNHKIELLPPEQEQAVEDILNDARQWYRKEGMISDEEWALYQEDLNSPNYPFG